MSQPDRNPSDSPLLRVDLAQLDAHTVVVTPIGEADASNVSKLRRALDAGIDSSQARIIVDLDQLTFMDASTLRVLMETRLKISAMGGCLAVRCHTSHGRRLLSLAGLESLLVPQA